MKRFVLFAALATCVGLSACDGSTLTDASSSQRVAYTGDQTDPMPVRPIDPEEPGDTTTYPPYVPPTIEYRISVGLYRSGGDMKAYTRFERGYNGSFTQVNASNLSVYCYVNGYLRDGETEYNAGYTHITFGESYQYGKQITCNHSANSGQYTATTSYTM
ncbi:MAG TPA: hypothetical protein VK399_13695 [Longimicrobiaceae bacterium]|jgi:hypothetical protein|nr:hypothetical protein [Longimicrobiaceae bacterium]